MVEAAKTTASAADIWAIVIVAVVALAGWLTAIVLADRSQVRASGPIMPGESRVADESGWVGRGLWVGGSVAGARAPEIPGEAEHEPIETPGRPGRDESTPPGEMSNQASMTTGPAGAGQQAMPRQRTGEADRVERSNAGPGARDDAEPGR